MDLVRCLLLIVFFSNTLGGGVFFSDDNTDWETATKQCQLAEPDLIFSSGDEVIVNTTVDIEEDVWIGYYQAMTAFEYFGCAVKDDLKRTFHTKADPGQCMSACGANTTIGIFGNECFCFENDDFHDDKQTMFRKCKKQCEGLNGVVCGGYSYGATYMSLYRSIGTDFRFIGNGVKGKNCMYYILHGYYWDDCLQRYAFLCGAGSSVWIEIDYGNTYDYSNWANAAEQCFFNKTRPATYKNTLNLHITYSTPQLWTGIVRSHVIYKYTNDLPNMVTASTFGYLKKDINGSIGLRFSSSTNIAKKSLCVMDTDASETSLPVSSISNGISTSAKTSSVPTEKTSLPKSTLKVYNDSTSQLKNGGFSDVGAVVGATLSVVAVIFIVTCLVLFVRKQGFHQSCRKNEQQASQNIVQKDHAYVNTQSDEILHSSVDKNCPEYAEIDEATLTDNGTEIDVINNDTTPSPVYSNDYFVIEKKACESTKPGNLNSDQDQPYEKLHFEDSPNYENHGKSKT